MAYICLALIG